MLDLELHGLLEHEWSVQGVGKIFLNVKDSVFEIGILKYFSLSLLKYRDCQLQKKVGAKGLIEEQEVQEERSREIKTKQGQPPLGHDKIKR